MNTQEQINFERIEKAICFINSQFTQQPSLEEIAAAVNISPFHFQRLFSEWAGVSPKKFMQYISLEYAKNLLKERVSIAEAAYQTGLSGSGRLHDLFIHIEGMTPGEYKQGGAALTINYSFAATPFGQVIIASTAKGICHLFFEADKTKAFNDLKERFPAATYHLTSTQLQQDALSIFRQDWQQLEQIKLHLAGTPFQIKVWESLLKIPAGALNTYGNIAQTIGNPKSSRAVGTAIGKNPVAFIIPCHRVIQSSGKLGGYMWGANRKRAIIGWEAVQKESSPAIN